jgi:hypothetical protein
MSSYPTNHFLNRCSLYESSTLLCSIGLICNRTSLSPFDKINYPTQLLLKIRSSGIQNALDCFSFNHYDASMNTILSCFICLVPASNESDNLYIDTPSANRGEIRAGTPLIQKFVLKNQTNRTITIHQLLGGCGCLKPKLSAQAILPNESVSVTMEISTLSQPSGPNRWRMTLKYRLDPTKEDPNPKEMESHLEVRATLIKEVQVEPASLVFVTSDALTKEIVLKDTRAKSLIVKSVQTGLPHLKGELLAPSKDKQGRSVQSIRLSLSGDCPSGHYSEMITLTSDDPDYPEIRIPIQIVKKSPQQVSASPEELLLRLSSTQSTASGIIRLRDNQERQIEIDRVEVDNPSLQFKTASGPGTMATLRIIVDLSKDRRTGEGFVKVHLKSPEKQTVVIPISWQAP